MGQPHIHAEFICAKANGSVIQEKTAGSLNWIDMHENDWRFLASDAYRIKPETKYPETRMQDGELAHAFHSTATTAQLKIIREGVNISIRRAIQDGDVILPENKGA